MNWLKPRPWLGGRARRGLAQHTPPLDRDERVVAWAPTGDEVVVVTNLGLWLPGAARLGWHEIHKVTWSGRELTLIAAREVAREAGYPIVIDVPAVSYTLRDPGHVPDQVRTRVNRSVAYSAYYPLPGGGGVRVVGRRVPGVDGVSWVVRYDAGSEPAPEVTGGLVNQARTRLG